MNTRHWILRANAVYLILASTAGLLLMDIPGAFFSRGPQAGIIAKAPYAAVGFTEAHGLALIIGVLLWRAAPTISWHLAAAAVHILLGTANIIFWQIFVAIDNLPMGYISTSLHWLFVVLQVGAAIMYRNDEAKVSGVPLR